MLLLPPLLRLQDEGEGVELLLPLHQRLHRAEAEAKAGPEAEAEADLLGGLGIGGACEMITCAPMHRSSDW